VSPWAAVDVISQPMSIQPLDGTEVSLVVTAWHPRPGLPGLLGPLLPDSWRAVAAVLAPLLHPQGLSLGLQASVLLTGPPGSGKKTAGRAAAAALGLHCITTSCLELRGQTEAKTAAALTSLFKEASRYSPCLLLLTDLEDLVGQRGAASATAHDLGQQRVADALLGGPPSPAALPPPTPAPTPPPPAPGLVLLLGLAKDLQDVAVPLGQAFTHQVAMEAAGREHHLALLREVLGGY
ncbi:hypothetical protein QJQ45_021655, partial [Haematococcus lacustris]